MMSSKILIYVMVHFQSKWCYWYINASNVQMIDAYSKNISLLAEADSQPCQTSNTEGSREIVNGSKPSTIFVKHFIFDV